MSIKGVFPIDKWVFKSSSILSDLPAEEMEMLFVNKTEKKYNKGEIIFWEGAFPFGIFYIVEGKAKKYKLDKSGKEQIIYVANTGELLGYHAILAGERYPDSAAALEDSLIAFIPGKDFQNVLQNSEILNRRLLKALSHEFTVLTNNLSLFSQKSVKERLALQLIVLREKYKKNFKSGMTVEIKMSQEDLANLVGTVRENIARIMAEFKDEGIISTKGSKITVLDVNKLITIANH